MSAQYANAPSASAVLLARKSWTAYFWPIVGAVLVLGLAVPIVWALSHSGTAAGVFALFVLLALIGHLASTRSVQLLVDDAGVWVASGILPWSRGVRGVKWRDLDEAMFYKGIWAWISRSFTVKISHRYTRTNEIVLSAMSHGDKAVAEINERLQTLIRDKTLTG